MSVGEDNGGERLARATRRPRAIRRVESIHEGMREADAIDGLLPETELVGREGNPPSQSPWGPMQLAMGNTSL